MRGLWSDELNYFEFYEMMQQSIERGFSQAWGQAMVASGIPVDEMTLEERAKLRQETLTELSFIDRFASYIEAHNKAEGGKLTPLFARTEQWANGYDRIYNLALTYARNDPKKKWVLHPAEHCKSCLKLAGKVKRASYWRSKGVYPKAWDKLQCRGGCKCTFEDTPEPLSRGPLPGLP